MTRMLFIVFSFCLFNCISVAQEVSVIDSVKKESKNIVYIELLGSGYGYSLNYERQFLKHKSVIMNGRIGISYFPWGYAGTIPVGASILYGMKKNKIETGMGVTSIFGQKKKTYSYEQGFSLFDWSIYSILGYRYQSDDRRIILRITYTPLYDPTQPIGYRYFHWGGISVGFKI